MTTPRTLSPLSATEGRFLFEHPVLGKYPAQYFIDDSLGYIWVHDPTWLDEAYSDAIAQTDVGQLARNMRNIDAVSTVLRHNGMHGARGLDIGGGHGVFVRGIRDVGHDFYWSDKYADNLMARGFEAGEGPFDVAVAFEVLEHLPNPLSFLQESRATFGWDSLIFSATCFDTTAIPDTNWWYWSFEAGQHISFFSTQCLAFMADELALNLVHLNGDLYAFSARPTLDWPRSWQRRRLRRQFKNASLIQSDFERAKARLQNPEAPEH